MTCIDESATAANGQHFSAHRSHTESARRSTLGLNKIALLATLHCLSGCAVGEVLGMMIGNALGFSSGHTIALAVGLAFLFGYAFTIVPLLRAGLSMRHAARLAFAADTASILIMEIVDNSMMLAIPGAMDAHLTEFRFWGALGASLAIAALVAFPVNRFLIARGRGHAVVHTHHGHH